MAIAAKSGMRARVAVVPGATEPGFRLGLCMASRTTDASKTQIDNIPASLLGMLALLGFTFSGVARSRAAGMAVLP